MNTTTSSVGTTAAHVGIAGAIIILLRAVLLHYKIDITAQDSMALTVILTLVLHAISNKLGIKASDKPTTGA